MRQIVPSALRTDMVDAAHEIAWHQRQTHELQSPANIAEKFYEELKELAQEHYDVFDSLVSIAFIHWISEAADVLYYAVQMDAQRPHFDLIPEHDIPSADVVLDILSRGDDKLADQIGIAWAAKFETRRRGIPKNHQAEYLAIARALSEFETLLAHPFYKKRGDEGR